MQTCRVLVPLVIHILKNHIFIIHEKGASQILEGPPYELRLELISSFDLVPSAA